MANVIVVGSQWVTRGNQEDRRLAERARRRGGALTRAATMPGTRWSSTGELQDRAGAVGVVRGTFASSAMAWCSTPTLPQRIAELAGQGIHITPDLLRVADNAR